MSATFTYKINAIRTATVGDNTGVVKQVEWTLVGTQADQTFELPQTTTLPDPDSEEFIPLTELTEAAVAAWIQAIDDRIDSIKAHIQYVLDKEVSKAALTTAPMPWVPVVETPDPAPTAPIV